MSEHEFRDFYYHARTVGDADLFRVSSSSADSSYMSFTDSLHTSKDEYDSLEKAFGLSPLSSLQGCNDIQTPKQHLCAAHTSSEVNSSSSSEAAYCEEDSEKIKKDKQPKGSDDGGLESPKKRIKAAKKKEERKQKEPRFAFMTKSEVDHLEDGYRWRKYGQKAVKNSPFPRSYYRCTTQKCTVKKRVERSFQDPSTVITTYEGQHNHTLPTTLRGNMAALLPPSMFAAPSQLAGPSIQRELLMHMVPHHMNNQAGGPVSVFAENISPFQLYYGHHPAPDYGLLQDMVPSKFLKHEP